MSSILRPLRLPLLVEERKKRESMKAEAEKMEASYSFYTLNSSSSDLASPVTPTFSARGHARFSSSISSFELAAPGTPEDQYSPVMVSETSSKRTLADVVEESPEFDPADDYVDFDDASSDQFDLTDCLRHEPRICDEADMTTSTGADFYDSRQDVDYDFGYARDSTHYSESVRSSRKLSRRLESPFSTLTNRIGSRLPSLSTRRSMKQLSMPGSPVSDTSLDRYSRLSRANSSRSSSLSASARYHYDRSNEPPLPPTPALSFYGSCDSIALGAPSETVEFDENVHQTLQRDRALATTPLLPPFMNGITAPPSTAQSSPLEPPTVAFSGPSEPQSPLVSPPLSAKPSLSSFPPILSSTELPPIPEPDAWSDILGHANFTILPTPYKPDTSSPESLRVFQNDWDLARVNYTKHLARTGEHYGDTSKTYSLTQAKWSEIERIWSRLHKEIAAELIASGAAIAASLKIEESVPTTLPRMAEGKFPERGDQDIVGPMVRQATMMSIGESTRRPSLWRRITGR